MTKYKIQVTFKESEKELEEFLKSKSSASSFLKDLALMEMKKKPIVIDKTKIKEDDLSEPKIDNDKKTMLNSLMK